MEYITLAQGKVGSDDSGFYLLDFNNNKMAPVVDDRLKGLTDASLCRLSKNLFMIAGGFKDNKVSPKAFTLDLNNGSFADLLDMPSGMVWADLLLHQNKVWRAGGRPTQDFDQVNTLWSFDLNEKKWKDEGTADFHVMGVHCMLGVGDFIYIVLHRRSLAKYDIKAKKWELLFNFTYDFDEAYAFDNKKIILINKYYQSIYEYDVTENTIVTIARETSGVYWVPFYVREIKAIVLIQPSLKGYFIYKPELGQWFVFNASDYSKFFGKLSRISTPSSYSFDASLKEPAFKTINGDFFKDALVVFGNWQQPFILRADLAQGEEAAELHKVNQALHLRSGIGSIALDESTVLLTGGFEDDYSYEESTDSFLYDIEARKVTQTANLLQECGSSQLRKVNLAKIMGKKVLSGQSQIVFMDNHSNFSIFQNKEFKEIPHGPLDESPLFLDELDRLIIFYTSSSDQKTDERKLTFKEYLFDQKKWVTLFQTKVNFEVTGDFCAKVGPSEYLIVVNAKEKSSLASMMLKYNGGEIYQVETVPLLELGKDYGAKKYFIIPDKIVLLLGDVSKESRKIYDFKKRMEVPNDVQANKICDAMNKKLSDIGSSALISSYTFLQRR